MTCKTFGLPEHIPEVVSSFPEEASIAPYAIMCPVSFCILKEEGFLSLFI